MKDIFQALQHWATEKLIESKDEEEGENDQKEQSHETDEMHEKQVNSFSDISYGVEEEEDIEEIHMSQNSMTTRSERKNTPFDILSPSKPPKNDPHTQKELDSPSKQTIPSNYVTKL